MIASTTPVPAGWRKSSYSNATGGSCVEVAEVWRKSSYSNGTGGNCVEVAASTDLVPVRDSKDTSRGHLMVPSGSWAQLVSHLK